MLYVAAQCIVGNSMLVDWWDAYWEFPPNQDIFTNFLWEFFACVHIQHTTYYLLAKSFSTASIVCSFKKKPEVNETTGSDIQPWTAACLWLMDLWSHQLSEMFSGRSLRESCSLKIRAEGVQQLDPFNVKSLGHDVMRSHERDQFRERDRDPLSINK